MWLTELRIVLPDQVIGRGAIEIRDGVIAAIVAGDGPDSAGSINGRGLTAVPGLIDLHGDKLEREIEPRPGSLFPIAIGVLEYDKRLAANGVTTAFAAVSFHDIGLRKILRTIDYGRSIATTIAELQPELLVDLRLHARCEITHATVLDLVGELIESGQVALISLNDHTPGQGQFRDIERYIERNADNHGVSREDFAAHTYQRIALADERRPGVDQLGTLTWGARDRGIVVASHDDDTPQKVALVRGLGVTISEFPVSLEAAQAARMNSMHVIMGAPNVLRGSSHSGNLSGREAIAAGLVDALASDYAPVALLQAAWSLANQGLLSLQRAIGLVTSGPAAAAGLFDRGKLEVGLRADLALIDGGAYPRVRATIRDGRPIYWDATMNGRREA
ncbi:MAG: phosphonate metabolism protein PhnM [Oscillochloris sp.]|nr:phosphonate metabolism protein PhnM [Oscillochloris sp.]